MKRAPRIYSIVYFVSDVEFFPDAFISSLVSFNWRKYAYHFDTFVCILYNTVNFILHKCTELSINWYSPGALGSLSPFNQWSVVWSGCAGLPPAPPFIFTLSPPTFSHTSTPRAEHCRADHIIILKISVACLDSMSHAISTGPRYVLVCQKR